MQFSLIRTTNRINQDWLQNNEGCPYTRLFLVIHGEGSISYERKKFQISQGKMYLIPGFTPVQYHSKKGIDCFCVQFVPKMSSGLNIFDILEFDFEVISKTEDNRLFRKLIKLNKENQFVKNNLNTLENSITISKIMESQHKLIAHFETSGILLQLFSRFIKSTKRNLFTDENDHKKRIIKAVSFIHQNLSRDIALDELSELCCYSSDYFSKLFYKVVGIRPIDYINKKKVESAQVLLVTSNESIEKISLEIGVENFPYFNRLFKKYSSCTPGEYRRLYQSFKEVS